MKRQSGGKEFLAGAVRGWAGVSPETVGDVRFGLLIFRPGEDLSGGAELGMTRKAQKKLTGWGRNPASSVKGENGI
jgi:hypothetical protein